MHINLGIHLPGRSFPPLPSSPPRLPPPPFPSFRHVIKWKELRGVTLMMKGGKEEGGVN